jgi:hypothetical protein
VDQACEDAVSDEFSGANGLLTGGIIGLSVAGASLAAIPPTLPSTPQPSTSPMLPFDRLLETDQLLWVEGKGSVETAMTAGFISGRDQMLELSL